MPCFWNRPRFAAPLLAVLAVLALALPAGAQTTVSPYFMVIVDTSASMINSTGSGTNSCGQARNKMSDAKCVLTNVVNGYGEAVFGLGRFAQVGCGALGATCSSSACTTGCGCRCVGLCGPDQGSGEVLVPIVEGNRSSVLSWVDYTCSSCTAAPGANQELMADGETPLAGSLLAAREYYRGNDPNFPSPITGDAFNSCRPYYVILLSDGIESTACAGDPVAAAASLRTTNAGGTNYDIRTFVIGFGVAPGTAQIENIANAGGTDAPGPNRGFYASDESSLALAFSQIMADAILVETCNGADDDCDTRIDEGHVLYCDRPGGISSQTECTDPGESVCDGVDDNCNGEVDEGTTNACGTCGAVPAEVCDLADNDCDGTIDEGCGGCVVEPEACDDLDNDCDMAVDEDVTRTCSTDVGECSTGTETCSTGSWGGCTGVEPSPEVCDGLDNDCDGVVDGMSRACGSDVGECVAGSEQCTSGAYGSCAGGVGPSAERCDGLDNDCDGATDEDDPGVGAPCGSDVGACTAGAIACSGGALVCQGATGPAPESCNGADDDCDGVSDESVPTDGSCGSDVGACSSGVRACMGGAYTCVGGTSPAPESCDGIDEDCDTRVDEDVATMGACGSDVGACTAGTRTCNGGTFVCAGEVRPSVETCNGVDDDCDGMTDEGDPGGGGGCGTDVGECTAGTYACLGGALTCTGGTSPSPETCNGRDDDCNGLTDDAVPTDGPCGSDEGECNPGVRVCVSGSFTCSGQRGPVAESCNGLDDDCDAATDEENPGGGDACGSDVGACVRGTSRCAAGRIECQGSTAPSPEACNAIDDDCDGLTDEGNPDGGAACGASDVGECELGALSCSGGVPVCIGERGPSPELCDGRDNDCDAMIDELDPEGGMPCGDDTGECVPGTTRCSGGALVCAGATGPTPETCNGLDDDCDGVIDDGIAVGAACGSDVGECSPGLNVCRDAAVVCDGAIEPSPEACDGLDNDCDGVVDEAIAGGAMCGSDEGRCEAGRFACIDGRNVCVGEVPPQREACDCEDNDCDGVIDEMPEGGGLLCPSGSACVACQCALPCVDSEFGPCPTGRAAVEDEAGCYCVADACDEASCAAESHPAEGEARCAPDTEGAPECVCKSNACTFPCDGVVCAAPTVCDPATARCVEDSCRALGCPDGELCDVDGPSCIPDPCLAMDCGRMACRRGACEPSCASAECAAGEVCRAGVCEADRCAGVSCGVGMVCDPADGECAANACADDTCPAQTECDPLTGRCELMACVGVLCPAGQRCDDDECVLVDVPRPDAGPGPGDDAGAPAMDGGAEPDAGDTYLVLAAGGCNCRAAPTGENGPLALALLVGLLLLLARRRRRGAARARRIGRGAGLAGLLLLALGASGCEVEPYCIGPGCSEAGVDAGAQMDAAADAGPVEQDAGPPDASFDAGVDAGGCAATEQCNGLDDDCDGTIDEGIDLSSDLENCGACGARCAPAGAFGACVASACEITSCDVCYFDLDEDAENGCEYRCCATEVDDAVCDLRDNDCDGSTDEDVDFAEDPANCGSCGRVCAFAHGSGACVAEACVLGDCDDGFYDVDGNPDNGCEHRCTVTGDETCNGRDDDCDGATDEGAPGGGASCGTDVGACAVGATRCDAGRIVCDGSVEPSTETCDGTDDDCDGSVDEGNPGGGRLCGTGTGTCEPGRETCVSGALTCVGETPPEPAETCDGLDNDCDGTTDEGNPGGGAACGEGTGACAEGALTCSGGALRCMGGTGPVEELCNGMDDDCDGSTDEGDPGGGRVCGTDTGVCVSGRERCVGGAQVCQGEVGAGAEQCNLLDDDCDGTVDEGNPGGGGACGNDVGACTAGTTVCSGGAVTCSGGTGPTAELCNGVDDDCDGSVDEGNPGGGGTCGTNVGQCSTGTLTCMGGGFVCAGGTSAGPEMCNSLDDDCDGATDEGDPEGGALCGTDEGQCAYGTRRCVGGALTCTGGTGPGAEACDGLDNDCDATVDEGNPGGGASCGTDTGACTAGTQACLGGTLTCTGGTSAGPEACNGADDDCDGGTDEGFDLSSDRNHCGACGNACSFPNAVAACQGGGCVLVSCRSGFHDANGDPADGCEYACSVGGAEVCNGLDDDCDGGTDEALTPPAGFCNPNGVCAGTTATCGGASRWVCNYPATYETPESTCDTLDNDCDGGVDETHPVGEACDNGELGVCRTTGTRTCNAVGDGTECGAPAGPAPSPETCNGLDDDCDGALDEGAAPAWVEYSTANGPRWIFPYEASRPDASPTSPGTMSHTVCSEPGRLPWATVTYAQAQAACGLVNGRLCTDDEWQAACEAGSGCGWSYAASCNSYQPDVCNGDGYDTDPGTPGDQDDVLPTGSLASCNARWDASRRLYDMSGNVEEWGLARQPGVNPIRGGSSNDSGGGMMCDFGFVVAGDTIALPTIGFRCCRETPLTCDDGALSGGETDVDCGGPCDGCDVGQMCTMASDCLSRSCGGGTCQAASCTDLAENGDETDVDCGGATCPGCQEHQLCNLDSDCASSACIHGLCRRGPCNNQFGLDGFGNRGCRSDPAGPPQCDDIRATGTKTALAGTSNEMVTVGLPFSFDFYGVSHTSVNISSYGALTFAGGAISWSNDSLPTPFEDVPIIAGSWDFWEPEPAVMDRGVYYQTLGTAPNRRFVVQWVAENRSGAANDLADFRIVLFERNDDIRVCYVDSIVGSTSYDNGRSATSGIQENSDGRFIQFSYNAANLSSGRVLDYYHP